MSAQLPNPLQPVANRVPVREQAPGRLRDVAVVLQVRLHGGHQVRLVLVVVGGERRERLLVEALQLARILAQRREQQAVRPRVLEGQQRVALRLGDVDGQERLLARAIEVDRILRAPAVSHDHREPRQRGPQLPPQTLRRAREMRIVGSRDDRRHLGRIPLAQGAQRARARRAQAPEAQRSAPARANRPTGPRAAAPAPPRCPRHRRHPPPAPPPSRPGRRGR